MTSINTMGIRLRSYEDPAGHWLPILQGVGVAAPGWQYEPTGHGNMILAPLGQ